VGTAHAVARSAESIRFSDLVSAAAGTPLDVIGNLLIADTGGMIERATIASHGKLLPRFNYLSDYVD
jgi:hypothetical protein